MPSNRKRASALLLAFVVCAVLATSTTAYSECNTPHREVIAHYWGPKCSGEVCIQGWYEIGTSHTYCDGTVEEWGNTDPADAAYISYEVIKTCDTQPCEIQPLS